MKNILIAVIFFTSQITFGSELDNEHSIIERTHLGQVLPGSLVVRESLRDGTVEVLHVNQQLPADKSAAATLAKAPFEPVNVDTRLAGTAGGSETDTLSSTPSWFWGFGLAALGIGIGAFALGRATSPAYGYGYAQPYYAPPAYYAAPAYAPPVYAQPYAPPAFYGRPVYAPTYSYGAERVAFRPYYAYNYGGFRYGYYANPYAYANYAARSFWNYQALTGP